MQKFENEQQHVKNHAIRPIPDEQLPRQAVDYTVTSHPAFSVNLISRIKLVPYIVLGWLNPVDILQQYSLQ